jgi:hypothetical protein
LIKIAKGDKKGSFKGREGTAAPFGGSGTSLCLNSLIKIAKGDKKERECGDSIPHLLEDQVCLNS